MRRRRSVASSVGCGTSSSKVGRSGFFSFSHHITCEDVLRLIRLYFHLSSILVDCTFARVYCVLPLLSYDYTTDAFLRVFVGFLGFFICHIPELGFIGCGFCITAAAQPSATVVPCIRPCYSFFLLIHMPFLNGHGFFYS